MNKRFSIFGIAFFLSIFISMLFFSGFLSSVNLKLTDNLYGAKIPSASIVIIAIDDQSLQELGRWPWNRSVFGAVVDNLNQSKVIGFDVGFFEKTEDDKQLQESITKAGNVVLPVQFTSFEEINNKIVGTEVLVPVFNNSDLGYINVITDVDGITRAVNFDISDDYNSFACTIYKKFLNKKACVNNQRFLTNFVGPPESFKYYSFSDIYNNKISEKTFKDKIVLIGSSAHELHDNYFVPTSQGVAMPGVEFHAHTIQTLLTRDFLSPQSDFSLVFLIFITSLLIAFLVINFRLLYTTIATIILIFFYLLTAIFIFNSSLILNIVYIPFTIILTFLSTVAFNFLTEKKSKLKIVGAFNKYVSPAVLNEILKAPDKLKLGGTKKEITVFFSDIRGFTTISENLSAEQLVHLLNEYLSAMTKIIMEHNGVVDKYIGDAIMAFWGAPLTQLDHAVLACSTSIDMMKQLKILQQKWRQEGFPELKIGIGLNSGDAVIGNMGSYDRFDYTAMGDNINLGSRLEGLTKQYGVDIIISESTKDKVIDKFISRKLDLVTVKGKNKPILIFELVCRKGELSTVQREKICSFEKGFNLYLNRDWDGAIQEFSKVDDFASKNMIDRCNSFKQNPPSKDWVGVWDIKKK